MDSADTTQKERLLFFTNSLGGGGAEMHLLRLLNHLNRDRFQLSLALSHAGGSYERDLADDVTVHHIAQDCVRSSTLGLVRAIRPLRKLIELERPDLLCSVMDYPNLVALRAAKKLSTRIKMVLLVQNSAIATYKEGEGILGTVAYRLIQYMYPAAKRVVALSKGVAEEYTRIVPSLSKKIEVINNIGIDEGVWRERKEEMGASSTRDVPLIVACGRLVELKGFSYLIRAIDSVQRQKSVQLIIIGEGAQRPALKAQIRKLQLQDAVHLLGFQDNPYKYMAAADLFVLSSIHEGFGNVVVEAMACGAPVVATDCPYGPGEIITNGVNGLLVPPADSEALARAILRVLSDDNLRRRLAHNGSRRARDFEASKIARDYEHLFVDVINGS